jgi:hypothetical protein
MQITTIGLILDIAKNVFQVHGIDAAENVVVRKQLRRSQVIAFFKALAPCLVGMEACATSHYWARELTKLGHQVRLMPAKDVKAYVKRNKNDAADAEAICEAVRRPTMRFVVIKSAEQQAHLMQHRARDLLIRQRTQLINANRLHHYAQVEGLPGRRRGQPRQRGESAGLSQRPRRCAGFNEFWLNHFKNNPPATTIIATSNSSFAINALRIEINTISLATKGKTKREVIRGPEPPAFDGYVSAIRCATFCFSRDSWRWRTAI